MFIIPDKRRSTYTRVHDVTPHKALIFNKKCKVILNLQAAGWYKSQIRDFETIIMILRNLILKLYDRWWRNVFRVRKKDCKNRISVEEPTQNITQVARDCRAPRLTFSCQKGHTQTHRRDPVAVDTAGFTAMKPKRGILFTIGRNFSLLQSVQTTSGVHTAYYSHAPHNDVSINDGPHRRRWSHKIII